MPRLALNSLPNLGEALNLFLTLNLPNAGIADLCYVAWTHMKILPGNCEVLGGYFWDVPDEDSLVDSKLTLETQHCLPANSLRASIGSAGVSNIHANILRIWLFFNALTIL